MFAQIFQLIQIINLLRIFDFHAEFSIKVLQYSFLCILRINCSVYDGCLIQRRIRIKSVILLFKCPFSSSFWFASCTSQTYMTAVTWSHDVDGSSWQTSQTKSWSNKMSLRVSKGGGAWLALSWCCSLLPAVCPAQAQGAAVQGRLFFKVLSSLRSVSGHAANMAIRFIKNLFLIAYLHNKYFRKIVPRKGK